ncbi:hypothetical protein DPMN_093008 [Dreissena polymorpha]|uniref:Uncharacterized protein n=1 Tax=Dreissena polymorpha TaxID=45954 RepID=A0A9D4L500_DREPO|nr:hypothetical protein DPMN_093008 [Dreissena polymorpha]
MQQDEIPPPASYIAPNPTPPPGRPRINKARIGDCQSREEFVTSLEKAFKNLPGRDAIGR